LRAARWAAGAAFVTAWLVYQALLPFVLKAWAVTGDEPHYLLAAHSLVYDGDLDLADNYANADYAAFYAGGYLDPHVRGQPDGTQLISHDSGLVFLLALPYAWAGRAGVLQFAILLGALLAAQMTLLGAEVSGRWWAGLLAALALGLTAPLGLYVFQIYPELAGGLAVTWCLRQVLGTAHWLAPSENPPAPSRGRTLLVALALAGLPWLSGRFAPLSVLLVGLAAWRTLAGPQRAPRSWLGALTSAALASLGLYLVVNFALYGGPTPSATPSGNAVLSGFRAIGGQQIGRGLIGWWLDQHRGLLVFGPALALAFVGLPHVWRGRGLAGLASFAPVAVMWGLASAWGGFYSGWEVSARFLMVGVPALAGGLAAAMAGVTGRARRLAFWPLAAGLVTLSATNLVVMALNPFVMLHQSPVALWETATGRVWRQWFPAAGTRYVVQPPAGEWRAPQGQAGYLVQSPPIDALSLGWYVLVGQAQLTEAADPEAVALSVDAYSSEAGLPLLRGEYRARDADPVTGVVDLRIAFYNPYVDRWSYPFYLDVRATGAAAVRVSPLLFEPDPGPTYGVAAAWLAALLALSIVFAPPRK